MLPCAKYIPPTLCLPAYKGIAAEASSFYWADRQAPSQII